MIYAVIDTNVIVSALLSKNPMASTVQVFEALIDEEICPIYNQDIIDEYIDVLCRPKFNFPEYEVKLIIDHIKKVGIASERVLSGEIFPDIDDAVFYEVALSYDDSYLVTGNVKHYPKNPIVVTPAEMVEIINSQ